MVVFPTAKINLGLHITAKRSDGYHNIETVFYPAGLSDALEFVIRDNHTGKDILISSGVNIDVDPDENIVIKAVQKLHERFSFPFIRIHLHKAIPSGAGLGGGSSDAAYIIKSLNKVFSFGLSDNELKDLALELGSDCPFFIDNQPSAATGRGEMLKPVNPVLKGFYLVLLHPGTGISTKEAFENCKPLKPPMNLTDLIQHPVSEWKNLIYNDFEEFAISRQPLIGKLKEQLYGSGAVFSLMSGSGSCVYGLFTGKPVLNENIRKFLIFEGSLF